MNFSSDQCKPSILGHTYLRTMILALILLSTGSSLALDHSGTIAADETWFAADNPHIVTANVSVNAGVTLTIEPGVEVYFNSSRDLIVRGILSAIGTVGQPILFTRNSVSDWGYISFPTTGNGTLDHCVIEYCSYGIYASSNTAISLTNSTVNNATYGIYSVSDNAFVVSGCQFLDNARGIFMTGGTLDLSSTTFMNNTAYGLYGDSVVPTFSDANISFDGNDTGMRIDDVPNLTFSDPLTITGSTEAGLHFENCDALVVDNQTLTGNLGPKGAFFIDDCGEFVLGAGNTNGGVGLENSWPLTIGMGSYPAAAGVIPTSGNTNNDIQVAGGTSTLVGTWRKFSGLDYIVTVNSTVDTGGELTIEPGVSVRLNSSRRLTVKGHLDALGTLAEPITFTRNTGSDWNYIYFQADGSGDFLHCLIEYATYAIYAVSTGAISLENTTLQNCNHGINSSLSNALTISDCLLQDNDNGISASGGTVSLAATDFLNNSNYGFFGDGVTPSLLDAAVVFDGNGTGFRIDDVASLSLTVPMTFSNNTTTGIHLEECDGATVDNQVLTGNQGSNGALFIDNCSEFFLGAGNTIGGPGLENSWPLSIGMGSFPAATAVIPTTGNTNNDIQVAGGSSGKTGTWRNFSALNYVVTTNSTIDTGGTLTLEPGISVRLNASRRLTIKGHLDALGTQAEPIVFTRHAANSWNYLYFQTDGSGNFENCLIEHATYGVYAASTGAISLDKTTVQDCNYGINSISSNALEVTDCLLQNNSNGLAATGGSVSLTSTAFENNSTVGFYGTGVTPSLLDGGTVFTNNGTGFRLDDVVGLNLTDPMSISGSTVAGIHLDNCESATIDNIYLTGNVGTNGALLFDDCGEIALGAGNTIGGAGLENSWPLSIHAGDYPAAASVIPSTGNTNNDIQVVGGSSVRSGTWRKFTGLDYVVATNTTITAGGELTIDPTVTVRFNGSRRLTISGNLIATNCVFTQNGAVTWNYLYFQTDGTGTLDNCLIEHASFGIYGTADTAIDLANTTVQDCNYGIYATGSTDVSLTDCLLEANNYGVHLGSGDVSFLRTRILNNATYGVYVNGGTPTFGSNITEWNDIYGNGSGVLGRDLRNHYTDIDAKYVHWGTMDHGEILDNTYDEHDNPIFGYITVLPYINSIHDTPSGVLDDGPGNGAVPLAFGLHQNAPNPFNPSTVIRFDLAAATKVQLRIYDISGALVATLLDEQVSAGYHQAVWHGNDEQGRNVASGLYFYRIQAGENLETRPMMLVK